MPHPTLRDTAALADHAADQPLRPQVVAEEVLVPLAEIDVTDETFATRWQPQTRDLEHALRADGQINVAHLRRRPDGKYQILAGFRRTTSAVRLGWTHLRAVVHEGLSDEECHRLAWKDNEQRQDLTPRDIGWTIGRHLHAGRNQKAVAALLDVSKATVSRHAGFLELPEFVRRQVGEQGFTMRHAIALTPWLRKHPHRNVEPLLHAYRQHPCEARKFARQVAAYFRQSGPQSKPTGVRMTASQLTVHEGKFAPEGLSPADRQALRQRLEALLARLVP